MAKKTKRKPLKPRSPTPGPYAVWAERVGGNPELVPQYNVGNTTAGAHEQGEGTPYMSVALVWDKADAENLVRVANSQSALIDAAWEAKVLLERVMQELPSLPGLGSVYAALDAALARAGVE